MPDLGFHNDWYDAMGLGLVDRVLKVKRIFRVSYKTILSRLDQRSKAKHEWTPETSFFNRFQIAGHYPRDRRLVKVDESKAQVAEPFKAREPDHLLKSDFMEDGLRTLVRRAIERKLMSSGRGAEILRIPLVTMNELAAAWV
jgi:hypothetical protein